MIHRLEIENFYSICETQVIDLRIGANVPDEEQRFAEINDGSSDRVPRTVALYGANASGKSTVLKALSVLRWFLSESINLPADARIPVLGFAGPEHEESPTRIRIHFDWIADLTSKDFVSALNMPFARYVYEIVFSGRPNLLGKSIHSEELRVHKGFGKSSRVFKRDEAGRVQAGAHFPIRGLGHVLTKLRPSVSLTSTIAQFAEHYPTQAFLTWARRITANIFLEKTEPDDNEVVHYYADRAQMVTELNKVIQKVDLGISSLLIAQSGEGPVIVLLHNGLNRPLGLPLESHGTRQFIKVFPHIKEALLTGGIAVLDELDSTIHPMLLPEILRWFHDPKENPHNAQLWFSGHSASLLEDLQKEEIFFTQKDSQGRTSIYGLKDIESVRRSDNFYQKYLGGVYGAVPRIG